jgi:hypothetical protein
MARSDTIAPDRARTNFRRHSTKLCLLVSAQCTKRYFVGALACVIARKEATHGTCAPGRLSAIMNCSICKFDTLCLYQAIDGKNLIGGGSTYPDMSSDRTGGKNVPTT